MAPTATRTSRNLPVSIAGTTVAPGRRQLVEVLVARLPTATRLTLPIMVLNGQQPGPRLWLSAVVHGDELNGLEIIRRVLELVRPRRLAGMLLAVPVVNVFGMVTETRYLPDRRDLNRSFPGSPKGSLAAQLADLFMTNVRRRATWASTCTRAATTGSTCHRSAATSRTPRPCAWPTRSVRR
jgi:uncharacterized protein